MDFIHQKKGQFHKLKALDWSGNLKAEPSEVGSNPFIHIQHIKAAL